MLWYPIVLDIINVNVNWRKSKTLLLLVSTFNRIKYLVSKLKMHVATPKPIRSAARLLSAARPYRFCDTGMGCVYNKANIAGRFSQGILINLQ